MQLGLWPTHGGLADQDALVVLVSLTMNAFATKQLKLKEKK